MPQIRAERNARKPCCRTGRRPLYSVVMNLNGRYIQRVRLFGPNARWYLLFSMLSGFAMGFMQLLFNLYVLAAGHDAATLGLLVALPPIVITIAAIPMGMLGQRFGFRTMLLLGALLLAGSIVGIASSTALVGLLVFSLTRGLGRTLMQVSSAPFMADNSGSEERTHLFSIQFAARMFANFGGLLLAGVIPGLLALWLEVGPESAASYRGALLVGASVQLLAILPLLRTRVSAPPPGGRTPLRAREMFQRPGLLLRLFLPQVVIGLGAGALVPFLNVFFKLEFGVPDSLLGALFAGQAVLMGIAMLIGPALAERWGKPRSVVGVQLASVPFLGLLGYAAWLPLAAVGFLCRAALMNMANPLYTAFAMEKVSERQRGTVSALMQVSWQGTRAVSSLGSGFLQEASGFVAIFPITIACYLIAPLLIFGFFVRRPGVSPRPS